jgi:RNA polymerase sigma-70 factor, ECF subfamily
MESVAFYFLFRAKFSYIWCNIQRLFYRRKNLICSSGATLEKETQTGDGFSLNGEASVALIRKIQDGDLSSLAILYDKTGRLLFGIISKVLRDRVLAEETLLDVYTYIWKEASSYDPGRLPLEWLTTIARTRAIAKLHWRKRIRKTREFSTGSPDSIITVAPEEQKLARSALESLIPMQREILDWIYYSGLSCNEIAAQIGKPLGAVRTHACLGLSKLNDMFRPLFESKPEATGGTVETRTSD